MKKFILGVVLGGALVASIAGVATNNYVKLVNKQNERIVELGNEVAHLKFANNQLKFENAQKE